MTALVHDFRGEAQAWNSIMQHTQGQKLPVLILSVPAGFPTHTSTSPITTPTGGPGQEMGKPVSPKGNGQDICLYVEEKQSTLP